MFFMADGLLLGIALGSKLAPMMNCQNIES